MLSLNNLMRQDKKCMECINKDWLLMNVNQYKNAASKDKTHYISSDKQIDTILFLFYLN